MSYFRKIKVGRLLRLRAQGLVRASQIVPAWDSEKAGADDRSWKCFRTQQFKVKVLSFRESVCLIPVSIRLVILDG